MVGQINLRLLCGRGVANTPLIMLVYSMFMGEEMERVIVVNKYKLKEHLPPEYTAVYIGRPSEYGNPFPVGPKYKQGEAVLAYEKLATEEGYEYPKLRKLLNEGHNLALVCFCKQYVGDPKPCHGDVIKRKLETWIQSPK